MTLTKEQAAILDEFLKQYCSTGRYITFRNECNVYNL